MTRAALLLALAFCLPAHAERTDSISNPFGDSPAPVTQPARIEPKPLPKPEIQRVEAKPAKDLVPANATAKCKDGTYSFSENRRGTCSWHGGVAKWLN